MSLSPSSSPLAMRTASRVRSFSSARPQTIVERLKSFSPSLLHFYKDYQLANHIHDASKTKRNAWSVREDPKFEKYHPVPHIHKTSITKDDKGVPVYKFDDQIRPGWIPRRQYEQQRLVREELKFMIPVGVGFMVPVLGYVPMLLAVLAPRVMLSRHFHNDHERKWNAIDAHRQRARYYSDVADRFWKRIGVENRERALADPVELYTMFEWTEEEDMPKQDLVNLIAASGYLQHFPGQIHGPVFQLLPAFFLRQELQKIAAVVCHDDLLLLEENSVASMTDEELTEACLMRGLAVKAPLAERRQALEDHLKTISDIRQNVKLDEQAEKKLAMFTLHLSPIQFDLRKDYES